MLTPSPTDTAAWIPGSWLLLGEHVSPLDLLGIVPVVLGVYLVTRPAAGKRLKPGVPAMIDRAR